MGLKIWGYSEENRSAAKASNILRIIVTLSIVLITY